jgi:hypothetical protein
LLPTAQKADALVLFAEQVELVVDLGPVLGRAVAVEGGLQHAEAGVQLGGGQQVEAAVDLAVQGAADQHEHARATRVNRGAEAQGDGVAGFGTHELHGHLPTGLLLRSLWGGLAREYQASRCHPPR